VCPMTTVFTSGRSYNASNCAGTHVLIVGVGGYPCLLGGDPELLLSNPMGLAQLSSPPLSAVALADWFVARQAPGKQGIESVGFYNPHAPLASVEMLVSPSLNYHCPDGSAVAIDGATRRNIAKGYRTWLARARSNPGNIAVLYFCGHGATGSNDYILPSDFGEDHPDNPWADAIDITETARAARREISGSLYFFIDACRQTSHDSLMPGAGTPALQSVDFEKNVLCFSRLLLWATAEGAVAFGVKRQVSRFTTALLEALSGFYGEELADDIDNWVVTGDALAKAVRTILDTQNSSLDKAKHQNIEQQLIGSHPFHFETQRPKTIGHLVSTWSVNPMVRALTNEQTSRALVGGALEALVEQVEQRNVQVDELRHEIHEWTRRYRELERRLADEPDSELMQQARAYLAAGKLEEAGTSLDELICAAEVRLHTNEARVLADRLRVASSYLDRGQVYSLQFNELQALSCYQKAYEFFPNDRGYWLPYAAALQRQNEYQRAEAIYTSALAALQRPEQPDTQVLHTLTVTLNNLAVLYRDTQRMVEAETAVKRALAISHKLAEANPSDYLPHVATTLNNLGLLHSDMRRLPEAELAYLEALGIRRKLAEANPADYQPHVATTLNNLGLLYTNTQRLSEAESVYRESLGIRRRLARSNPAAYLPAVAMTLHNVGMLYRATQRLTDAKISYQEALGIRRKLAEANPAAYLPRVAATLHNLGMLYNDTQCRTEAECTYLETLGICRKLADANPAAYLPDVAETLNNLGLLYCDTQRMAEAETSFGEALGIFRKLAAINSATYIPEVATTLRNLAILYRSMQRPTQAKDASQEALDIGRKLPQPNPNG
jgi:tetratricopeptide (TPR) repeat protein